MRRRVVPALIALLAAALAAWRRRARRDGAAGPVLADDPAARLPVPARQLEAAPAAPHTASAPGAPPGASAPAAPQAASAPAAAPSAPPAPLATPEPPVADTGTPAAPAPAAAPGPADDGGPRFVSVPWTLLADEQGTASNRRELAIRFTLLGGRMALDRVDVRETDSQVFVTVLARCEPADPGRPAPPAYGVAGETTVQLQRPLGDRALVHAPDQLAELIRRDG